MIQFTVRNDRPGYILTTKTKPTGNGYAKLVDTWKQVLKARGSVSHWTQRKCVKKDMEASYFTAMADVTKLPAEPWSKAKVSIEIVVAQDVRRDYDNLLASVKGVLDSLGGPRDFRKRKLGIITDDNMSVIGRPEVSVVVDRARAYQYTVTIEEVTADQSAH